MTSRGTARQGRYQTRELLGRGGTADVYRGFDTRLGRPVAIKRLRPDLAPNPVFRARFRREAQAAAKLCDSSIVAVYDSGEERDDSGSSIPFIVMELVDGHTLRETLRDDGRVPPCRALELTSSVLDALTCSHAAGIVHRDIKPGNILISSDGEVKVADFGIARAMSDMSGTVTAAGTVLGTAHYISPEQGRGDSVDERSDIYSVGCMLYELLVGEPPFTADSLVGILYKHVSEPPPAPSAGNADVTPEVDAIVLKALAKDPAERYQRASQMKAEIHAALVTMHGVPAIEQATAGEVADASGESLASELVEPPTAAYPDRHPAVEEPDPRAWQRVEGLVPALPRQMRRRRPRLVAAMAGVVAVLLLGGVFGVSQLVQPAAADAPVTVPAVLGFRQAAADTALRNAQLVARVEFVIGATDGPVDIVVAQSPSAGSTTAPGGLVTVIISIRPTVPAPVEPATTRPTNVPNSGGTTQDVISGHPATQATNDTSAAASSGSASRDGSSGDTQQESKKHDKGRSRGKD